MPHNPTNERITLVLSPAQHKALVEYAESKGIEAAEVIRRLLIENVAGFPDDLHRRGKYSRKKAE